MSVREEIGTHGQLHKSHLSSGAVVQENIAVTMKMFKGSSATSMAMSIWQLAWYVHHKIVIVLYVTMVTMVRSVLIRHGSAIMLPW